MSGGRTGAELILAAAGVAADAHAGQVRKGSSARPYVGHPIAVARMVASVTDDAEVIAAALLHDVVEDSDMTLGGLRATFGGRVAGIVGELTDPPETEGWSRARRKARQAEHLGSASVEARTIKIADQTSNLEDLAREPDAESAEGHAQYRAGAAAVVAACRDACPALARRFDDARRAHAAATASAA